MKPSTDTISTKLEIWIISCVTMVLSLVMLYIGSRMPMNLSWLVGEEMRLMTAPFCLTLTIMVATIDAIRARLRTFSSLAWLVVAKNWLFLSAMLTIAEGGGSHPDIPGSEFAQLAGAVIWVLTVVVAVFNARKLLKEIELPTIEKVWISFLTIPLFGNLFGFLHLSFLFAGKKKDELVEKLVKWGEDS